MSVGYLACSFDLLHVGHLAAIEQARTRCTELVLGVFSDELVAELMGRPPVVPFAERLALASHLRGAREARVHDGQWPVDVGADPVFVVVGEVPGDLPGAVQLAPARASSSAALLAALRPVDRDAVAS